MIDEFIEYADKNNVDYSWKENVHSEDCPFLVTEKDLFLEFFNKRVRGLIK